MGSSSTRIFLGGIALVVVAIVAGCDEIIAPTPAPPERAAASGPDAAGAPAPQCAPGLRPLDDASCQPPGIRACSAGFELDPRGGCSPILPSGECPAGQLAIPGETECHEIMPCPPPGDHWGDIPDGPTTRHVDASYTGTDSDGTRAKPFATINAALAIAHSGDIIGIAAGKYDERLVIRDMRLDVRGVCPRQVEIHSPEALPTVGFVNGSAGSAISGVALTGPDVGLLTVSDIRAERIWVHDTSDFAIAVADSGAEPGKLTARDVLVEDNECIAAFGIEGTELDMERSVVRNNRYQATGRGGRAVDVEQSVQPGGPRGKAHLARVVAVNNNEVAIYASGSDVDMEAVVVRDTQGPPVSSVFGRGVSIQDSATHGQSTLAMKGCVVERNHEVGVAITGGIAEIDNTTIRDTLPTAAGSGGIAVHADPSRETKSTSTLTMRECLVDKSVGAGIGIISSEASLESVHVRDVQPHTDGSGGLGISVQFDYEKLAGKLRGSNATIRWSTIEDVHVVALGVLGSVAELEGVRIENVKGRGSDGAFGDGISIVADHADASIVLKHSSIRNSNRAGLSNFGAIAKVEDCTFRCNQFDLNGEPLEGRDFTFEAAGTNRCGCRSDVVCQAVSEALTPPPAAP